MMRLYFLLLSLILLGCQPGDQSSADVAPERSVKRSAAATAEQVVSGPELFTQLWKHGRSLGETRAEVQQRFGTPVAVRAEARPSDYSANPDSILRLEYPGLRFSFLRAGYDGREFIGEIALSNPNHELPGGIRIGQTSRSAVIGLLGQPRESTTRGDSLVLYYEPEDAVVEHGMYFAFVRDLLQKVRWEHYID